MKKLSAYLFFILLAAAPSLSFAKGVPMFYQTGDELFEIEGAPDFEDGYSVGYACKRFALFGADIWTWDCEIMAISIDEFAAGDLDPEFKAEMEAMYSTSDRVRNPWNQYGFLAIFAFFGIGLVSKLRS